MEDHGGVTVCNSSTVGYLAADTTDVILGGFQMTYSITVSDGGIVTIACNTAHIVYSSIYIAFEEAVLDSGETKFTCDNTSVNIIPSTMSFDIRVYETKIFHRHMTVNLREKPHFIVIVGRHYIQSADDMPIAIQIALESFGRVPYCQACRIPIAAGYIFPLIVNKVCGDFEIFISTSSGNLIIFST